MHEKRGERWDQMAAALRLPMNEQTATKNRQKCEIFPLPIFTLEVVQSFLVIVTLLGPKKIVILRECQHNRCFYILQLPFWTYMVDKKLTQ